MTGQVSMTSQTFFRNIFLKILSTLIRCLQRNTDLPQYGWIKILVEGRQTNWNDVGSKANRAVQLQQSQIILGEFKTKLGVVSGVDLTPLNSNGQIHIILIFLE